MIPKGNAAIARATRMDTDDEEEEEEEDDDEEEEEVTPLPWLLDLSSFNNAPINLATNCCAESLASVVDPNPAWTLPLPFPLLADAFLSFAVSSPAAVVSAAFGDSLSDSTANNLVSVWSLFVHMASKLLPKVSHQLTDSVEGILYRHRASSNIHNTTPDNSRGLM